MEKNLAAQLENRLSPKSLSLIRTTGALAAKLRFGLYLVGGAVRDILLGRDNLDLDLVVEGDAPELATSLAERISAKVLVHRRFRTAKLQYDGLSIDLTTARSEAYAHPGALPTVCPGSIRDDLLRRDFTINAMAIHLDPENFGYLVDPFSGEEDLRHEIIRILHQKSFVDDATRMLRAIRYEQRFGFQLESNTELLLCQSIPMLSTVSGDRIRHELELILKEDRPEDHLHRAEGLGLLQKVHPSLKGNGWLGNKYQQARSVSTPPMTLHFALLTYRFGNEETEDFIARLRIPGKTATVIRDTFRLKEKLPSLSGPELSPSSIHRLLQGYSPTAILACAIASDPMTVRERLHLYLNKLRHVRTSLDGEALRQMGMPPGPPLGEMLRILHEARLDGRLKTREEETEFVRLSLAKGE